MKRLLTLILMAVCAVPAALACPVRVFNDTAEPIALVSHDGNQLVLLEPDTQGVYGSSLQHAMFYVMRPKAAGDFRAAVSITQRYCSATPLFFNASQLISMDSAIDRDMFEVKEYVWAPHHHDEE